MDIEVVRVEIAKLEVKPGDTLVIKFKSHMPDEQVERIKRVVENILPDGVKVLAYPDDEIELMVVSG